MTPEKIEILRSSFDKVAPISETAAELFYARLFEIAPEVKPMFKGDMKEQGKKLMASIAAVVKGIENPEKILPVLEKMGADHVKYGVKDEQYDIVGAALIWTLNKGLGDAFTEEVEAVWTEAYGIIATTMKKGAASVA